MQQLTGTERQLFRAISICVEENFRDISQQSPVARKT